MQAHFDVEMGVRILEVVDSVAVKFKPLMSQLLLNCSIFATAWRKSSSTETFSPSCFGSWCRGVGFTSRPWWLPRPLRNSQYLG